MAESIAEQIAAKKTTAVVALFDFLGKKGDWTTKAGQDLVKAAVAEQVENGDLILAEE